MHCKEEDSSGEVIVSHVLVPGYPSSLEEVKMADSKAGHQVESVQIRSAYVHCKEFWFYSVTVVAPMFV